MPIQSLMLAYCTLLFLIFSILSILYFVPTNPKAGRIVSHSAYLGLITNTPFEQTSAPNSYTYYLLIISIVIIAILLWLFLRTHQKLNTIKEESRTVFGALDAVVAVISNERRIVKMIQCSKELLPTKPEDSIDKSPHELFDKELADLMASVTDQCFETRETLIWEYDITLNGKKHFFLGRLVYQSPTRAIFSAFDITTRKRVEEKLKKSANKVQEMNDVKDRFFSIIAHDLRSPVGSFKMLSGIMLKNFGKSDPEKTKQMLSSIHLASSNLYDLLENLLSWSHNQRKSLTLNPQHHILFDLVDDAIDSQLVHSELKNIKIINDLRPNCTAICDQYVTLTVIRNLVSNAIKFTPKNGSIRIFCDHIDKNQKHYCTVSVSDSGIGIPEEKLESIFNFNPNKSTIGTNNESGSGLGLILCKEFVEKQDGFIEIQSVENEGTTVTICLPSDKNEEKIPIVQEQVFLS